MTWPFLEQHRIKAKTASFKGVMKYAKVDSITTLVKFTIGERLTDHLMTIPMHKKRKLGITALGLHLIVFTDMLENMSRE